MRKFGLIGFPLSHSFSKKYFEEKFQRDRLNDCSYSLFELKQVNDIIDLRLSEPNLVGLNVTIPYKQSIIPYLDGLSDRAQKIGAVNTIKIKDGTWIGHNTDIHGFQQTLEPLLKAKKNAALILGSGGASLAVKYVLEQFSIPFCMVSRTEKEGCILYNQLNESILTKYNILINTTPLGMFPHLLEMPEIPFQFINSSHVFYDLIYNPELTLLLKTAKDRGCVVKNGLEMLQIQAEKSWEIWNVESGN
jgi:shikimate dehydrogenase